MRLTPKQRAVLRAVGENLYPSGDPRWVTPRYALDLAPGSTQERAATRTAHLLADRGLLKQQSHWNGGPVWMFKVTPKGLELLERWKTPAYAPPPATKAVRS